MSWASSSLGINGVSQSGRWRGRGHPSALVCRGHMLTCACVPCLQQAADAATALCAGLQAEPGELIAHSRRLLDAGPVASLAKLGCPIPMPRRAAVLGAILRQKVSLLRRRKPNQLDCLGIVGPWSMSMD